MSSTITVAAPPNTVTVAANILGSMSAQSGVVTDLNAGAQLRTLAESIGSVSELQGYTAQAQAFQALVYSAYSAYGISPLIAQSAQGTITFLTGLGGSPPPAAQSISIPAGTVVQTVGGMQFITTNSVVLAQGSTSITANISAIVAGTAGNVSSGTITQIITGLSYALYCTNASATAGGLNAEQPAQTLARFTAAVAATGLSTPVSIANACIGVAVSGTTETVAYSTIYEPWVIQQQNSQPIVPGFQVYIDNGSGAASANLISAVETKLNGILGTSTLGYRPAGVPYTVSGVSPVYSSVVVSGTHIGGSSITSLTNATVSAIQSYYATLAFTDTAELNSLIAAVSNATAPSLSALQVYLLNGSSVSVSGIAAAYNQRVILQSYTVNII